MTTITSRTRLATAGAVLALALAGCAGTTDTGATTGDEEGLPTAEDLGVEDDGGAVSSPVCAEGEPDCEDTAVNDGGEVSSGMCAEEAPDCEDMIVNSDGGAAAGSCLPGDETCTDESFDGQDVARPVRVGTTLDDDAMPATRGATGGASGRTIEAATLVDDDTVRLAVIGNSCMLIEDVLVTESPDEVRVLVLAGTDAEVQACDDEGLWWSVDIDLDAPLDDRLLLDLAD